MLRGQALATTPGLGAARPGSSAPAPRAAFARPRGAAARDREHRGPGRRRRKAAALHDLEIHSPDRAAAYSANLLLHPDHEARTAARISLHRAIAFTERVGGIATGGHVGAFAVDDWADPDRRRQGWGDLRAALANLAHDARRAGLEYLVVENLAAAREPSTMAMIRELLDDGDALRVPIRLCLDVGHMCVPGTSGDDRDPYAWLRAFAPVAPMVQLQQSDAEGDHHWPFTSERNAVADRTTDRSWTR